MQTINFRRVFLIASAISLAIIYVFLWLRTLSDPIQYTGTDFVPFYAAAQISINEGPGKIYDLNLQKIYEEELVGFGIRVEDVNIFVNPPYVIPLVRLIFLPSFRDSFILWEILMGGFLLIGVYLLLLLMQTEIKFKPMVIFLFGFVLFFPVYQSLLIGQNSTLLFFGACMWLFGLITKRDNLAGIGLAVMTIRPHIALPLALPFIFKRRCVFWWFIIGSGILAIFSLIYAGMDGILGFLKMMTVSAAGINTTVKEQNMVNLIGLLIRTFPDIPISIIHLTGWAAYLISIFSLCLLWIKSPVIGGTQVGLAILAATFTAPHLHMHDLLLWTIPLAVILLSVREKPELIEKVSALPMWLSMAILCCYFSPILAAVIPYMILVLLICAILIPDRLFSPTNHQKRTSP